MIILLLECLLVGKIFKSCPHNPNTYRFGVYIALYVFHMLVNENNSQNNEANIPFLFTKQFIFYSLEKKFPVYSLFGSFMLC